MGFCNGIFSDLGDFFSGKDFLKLPGTHGMT